MNHEHNISLVVNQACKKGCHSCSFAYEKEVYINWDLKLSPEVDTFMPATNDSLTIYASIQGEAVIGVIPNYDASKFTQNFFFGKIFGNHHMKGFFIAPNQTGGIIIAKHEPFQADKSLTFKMYSINKNVKTFVVMDEQNRFKLDMNNL